MVSGGYVHAEFRYLLQHAFEVYPYVESQWAGSRGMNYKISTGLQSRYRLANTKHFLMFANLGCSTNSRNGNIPTLLLALVVMLIAAVLRAIYR